MTITRQQRLAQAAYKAVKDRSNELNASFKDGYASFAKSFPALIHGAGLCQAVAFATAKGKGDAEQKATDTDKAHTRVLEDLVETMQEDSECDSFHDKVRKEPTIEYLRLTRRALDAATWLKRYAEAFEVDKKSDEEQGKADDARADGENRS